MNVEGGVLRGAQAVRVDVGGGHGAGHVDREHDRGPLARDLAVDLRARQREHQAGQRQQRQGERQVPAQARAGVGRAR